MAKEAIYPKPGMQQGRIQDFVRGGSKVVGRTLLKESIHDYISTYDVKSMRISIGWFLPGSYGMSTSSCTNFTFRDTLRSGMESASDCACCDCICCCVYSIL